MNNEVKIKMVCKPYTLHAREEYELLVDLDEPRVRVWDHVGHIYTVCHVLSPASQRAAIAKARRTVAAR